MVSTAAPAPPATMTTFARVLALALSCLGAALIAAPFLPWVSWSPDPTQGTTHVSLGGGNVALSVAALGLVLALMGFLALPRPSSWLFGAMLFASIVGAVAAIAVLESRSSTAQGLANALIQQNCSSQCGVPDVHPGPGFDLSILLTVGAFVCAITGLLTCLDRKPR